MAVLPTADDLYAVAKAEVIARNPSLTDWREGSRLDAVAGAQAMLGDQVVLALVALFATQFVDTATGTDLDALALDRFGLVRQASSPAVGGVTWTKTAGLAYTIPAGTVFSGTVNGQRITVESTGDTSIGLADDTVDVTCAAQTAGVDGNAAAGVITTIDTSFPTDAGATVTNAARFAGGAAAETDDAFRDRIRRYFRTLAQGTADALLYAARGVAGIRYATVDETYVESSGVSYVYIGDPDANSNDALADLAQVAIDAVRAVGCRVVCLGAAREETLIDIALTVLPGADRDTIKASAKAAIVAYAATLNPSQALRLSKIEQVAHNAHPDIVSVAVVSPTADTSPSVRQNAIRVVTSGITVSSITEGT